MKQQLAAIGFAPDLIPLIEKGIKTLTYRVGNKYDYLKVGDKIQFKNSESGQIVGKIEITEKSLTTFKDLPLNTKGHEIYPSKQIQRETFNKYYKQNINDNEPMLILGFKVISLEGTLPPSSK